MKNLNELLNGTCEDLVNDYLEEKDILKLSYEHYEIIKNGSKHPMIKELLDKLRNMGCEVSEEDLIDYVLEKIKVLAVQHLYDKYVDTISVKKSTSFN
ncbi:hypothetical protein [Clostridium paraputrificum]|uniref:Uncharacterized protein n=1 Tax=Clostridium paraputrificum TaxID=29363 RepID=A0A6N3F860_9CLOT